MARFHWCKAGPTTRIQPDCNRESNTMKWLSSGLTFLNFATICGLLIGMVAGGLNTPAAIAALLLAAALAVLAYLRTSDPETDTSVERDESPGSKYRKLPIWILCAFFAF